MTDSRTVSGSKSHPTSIQPEPVDWRRVWHDFPLLNQRVYGKPLTYLDNAATSQKPAVVLEALEHYYRYDNANVHRSVHAIGERATKAYEASRDKVQAFLNASRREEIVFVRGTTEAINLVAQSFVRPRLRKGDEILISTMEHHSNIVPWQILCQQTGAVLKVIPITDCGEICLDDYRRLLGERTRMVSLTHTSNALGSIPPVQQMIAIAHSQGIPVLLDGAQAAPHMMVDVQALDCDFYAFSGHKLYGPTGIGVLYGKYPLLDTMPPYQGGGEMISKVSFDQTLYNVLPYKFEAGTPNIAGAVGLGAALDYVTSLGMDNIVQREQQLLDYATDALQSVRGLRIIGTARDKASIVSFVLDSAHPHDISSILDREGVAVRAGHHCAMPLMDRFGVPATARVSLAFYNSEDDIESLLRGLAQVNDIFG